MGITVTVYKELMERASSAKIYTQVANREFIVSCCQYLFKYIEKNV